MRLLLAMLLILFPLGVFADGEATLLPQADGSLIVHLSPDAVRTCAENGGCRIVTGNELRAALDRARATCQDI